MANITLTLREVVGAVPVLTKLTALRFPAAVAFDLARLVKKLQEELNVYDETRVALVKKYGEQVPIMAKVEGSDEETPTGQFRVQVKPSCLDAFNTEFQALLNKQVEVLSVSLLPQSTLTSAFGEDDLISVEEMGTILFLIKPDNEAE